MSIQEAKALFQQNAEGHWHLNIRNQGLGPFCHTQDQKAVLALPGINLLINEKVVSAERLARNRDSYTNALLIHSRGIREVPPCDKCKNAIENRGNFKKPFY